MDNYNGLGHLIMSAVFFLIFVWLVIGFCFAGERSAKEKNELYNRCLQSYEHDEFECYEMIIKGK